MKTKRISNKIEKVLNDQMTREAYQAQIYLSYASWAEYNSYAGVANFLYKHAHEEREHMFKLIKYINDRGGKTKIEAIKAPHSDPKDMEDCLKKVLKHEIDNSAAIDAIVNLAHEEKDWATFNFGQWFVKEQMEEEKLVNNLLDKFNLASKEVSNNSNLYEMDKDLGSASQGAIIAQDERF
jgi:ferritin